MYNGTYVHIYIVKKFDIQEIGTYLSRCQKTFFVDFANGSTYSAIAGDFLNSVSNGKSQNRDTIRFGTLKKSSKLKF